MLMGRTSDVSASR